MKRPTATSLNLNVHFHCVFLEGIYLDRTEAGLKPRFIKGEPPSDADIAAVCSCGAGDVVQTISRRVIRKLRHLGYLDVAAQEHHGVCSQTSHLLSSDSVRI